MKTILLFFTLIPLVSLALTKTTVGNGNFYNPLTWDCMCFPADGDSLVINHAVTMDVSIYYTSGRITINPGGSLIEDATDRAFWADGTASLVNGGTFTSHLFLLSPGGTLTNTGSFANVDSVWNQGYVMNMGTIGVYDLLNDQTATFHNHANLNIANNINNQGYFHMNDMGVMEVGNDYSNCNIQTQDAWFENHGIVCITNDFSNCAGDTLAGSGDYFIGGSSANLGVFTGTFTFHTPSGTIGIPGTIDPGVTVTTGSCNLGLSQSEEEAFRLYPNPTATEINTTVTDCDFTLYDCTGKIVKEGKVANYQIDLSNMKTGFYLLKIEGFGTNRIIKK